MATILSLQQQFHHTVAVKYGHFLDDPTFYGAKGRIGERVVSTIGRWR